MYILRGSLLFGGEHRRGDWREGFRELEVVVQKHSIRLIIQSVHSGFRLR